jgi:hypothetical protein
VHYSGFVALASHDGGIGTIIRTAPYVATGIAIAPDGTIWTVGYEADNVKKALVATDKGVIRHMDSSGNPLADFLPQSSLSPRELQFGTAELACNSSRVGWYQSRGGAAYFEVVDHKVERYPILQDGSPDVAIMGLSITTDDQVLLTSSVHGNNPHLYWLDRRQRAWTRIDAPAGAASWLLGGSGNTLVFFGAPGDTQRLRRFEVLPQ